MGYFVSPAVAPDQRVEIDSEDAVAVCCTEGCDNLVSVVSRDPLETWGAIVLGRMHGFVYHHAQSSWSFQVFGVSSEGDLGVDVFPAGFAVHASSSS